MNSSAQLPILPSTFALKKSERSEKNFTKEEPYRLFLEL